VWPEDAAFDPFGQSGTRATGIRSRPLSSPSVLGLTSWRGVGWIQLARHQQEEWQGRGWPLRLRLGIWSIPNGGPRNGLRDPAGEKEMTFWEPDFRRPYVSGVAALGARSTRR